VVILGFGLVWLASGWVSTRLFRDPSLKPLILLGAVTLVVSAFDRTARAVLRVFDRFGALGYARRSRRCGACSSWSPR
jgi:O-antigen/teichoic acid export membrane protein